MARIESHDLLEFQLELLFCAEIPAGELIQKCLVGLIDHGLVERLAHALRHRVVEGIDGLAAKHIILIALDGNAGQRCIGTDAVRLAQETMPRREPAVEQLQQIDLAAVERDQREILVMDMDPVLLVRLAELIRQHIVIDKVLGTLRTELEHDAHRRIGVDVCIVALEIDIHSISKENVAVGRHQVLLRRAALGMLLPIGDVLLRHIIEIVFHELLLNDILDFLHADVRTILDIPFDLARHLIDVLVSHHLAAVHVSAGNSIENLLTIIGHGMARTFRNCL